jgi:hypothetical protein
MWPMADFAHGGGAGQIQFEQLLALRFPSVAAGLDDIERGLLHLEMAAFARATRSAIDRGDFAGVQRHLAFIDELFNDAAPDLENAIYVCYLKNTHDDQH